MDTTNLSISITNKSKLYLATYKKNKIKYYKGSFRFLLKAIHFWYKTYKLIK